ncbi:MAG: DUF2750 domain-containing protein [Burkholderiales bacterium]|nr:DUF2750 domain-containing protein [Burkholderiales bacterium]
MSYRLTEIERSRVLELDGAKRFQHFIKRVADWGNVWSLRGPDGWVAGQAAVDELAAFVVWPHPDYALLCASNEWVDSEPASIDLEGFLAEWLPSMERDGVLVAVFPTPGGRAVTMSARDLRVVLEQELEQY